MKKENSLIYPYSNPLIIRSKPIAVLLIAVSYILLFKLSFLITFINVSVSPVFLPSGLALASVLILGRKALIGIGLGSFLANAFISMELPNKLGEPFIPLVTTSLVIASSTVLASFVTDLVLNSLCKKGNILRNGQNILCLLFCGPMVYCTITSIISVSILYLDGSVSIEQFWYAYKTWWIGDAIGIILITPLILSWFLVDAFKKENFKFFEMSLHGTITILFCFAIFFKLHDLKYLIIPLLFWSSYRFPIQITTFVILIISLFAIATTIQGIGPFNEEHINDSILFLNLFLITISICSLFLSGIITERNRAEIEVKTSENNLRKNQTLLQSTLESPRNFSIYSVNLNYEYLSFNSQHSLNMKELYDIDIALGMKIHDCIKDHSELDITVKTLNKSFLGEDITKVRYFETNDRYLEFRTSPIINKENEIIGATVISTNITQKIKDNEALKKSEEKYRNIFENIQDVIFQTDINGVFMDLSPSVKDFCGYTAEELIGKPMIFLQPDDEKSDTVVKLVNEQSVVNYYERLIKTKSGLLKHISLSAKMIFDNNGNKLHINAIARDITQRKENEKEIAFQNQKLQIQNKELEQFAYITSHDLQEPLVTLKFFSELIKNEYPKEINEDIKQYLQFILESSDRMQKLVKGLLDYSRIGNQTEQQEIDCNEILNEAINSLSDIIRETNCKITSENLPQLNGYSVEMIALFQHLISNSIKFRKKTVPITIKISAKLFDHNWHFSVQDNGIGIDEQNKEKAFVIFKRLNNREDYPGIGIGLAICKKIIALHEGNIWIESTLGSGTTIHFTIPKKR